MVNDPLLCTRGFLLHAVQRPRSIRPACQPCVPRYCPRPRCPLPASWPGSQCPGRPLSAAVPLLLQGPRPGGRAGPKRFLLPAPGGRLTRRGSESVRGYSLPDGEAFVPGLRASAVARRPTPVPSASPDDDRSGVTRAEGPRRSWICSRDRGARCLSPAWHGRRGPHVLQWWLRWLLPPVFSGLSCREAQGWAWSHWASLSQASPRPCLPSRSPCDLPSKRTRGAPSPVRAETPTTPSELAPLHAGLMLPLPRPPCQASGTIPQPWGTRWLSASG